MVATATGFLWVLLLGAVPGSDETPSLYEVIPRGEALLAERGCLSCHSAPPVAIERLSPNPAPRLADVGARLTPQYLRHYLEAPHTIRPGARMPDLLGGLEDTKRRAAVEDLVQFLASLGGPIDHDPSAGGLEELESGRRLFHESGCIACHAPIEPVEALERPYGHYSDAELNAFFEEEDEGLFEIPAIPGAWVPTDIRLADLAERTSVDALSAFLRDPESVRPGGRMPSLSLTEEEAKDLAFYLLRQQAKKSEAPGIGYEYFEAQNESPVPSVEGLSPSRTGRVDDLGSLPEHRPDQFVFRFRASLKIPADGRYRFFTTSDDGSRLWIDDQLVVQNDGTHPMQERSGQIELTAGSHRLTVICFEAGGGEGLSVSWEGPGLEKQVIDESVTTTASLAFQVPTDGSFQPDPERAARGRARFFALGCASCHDDVRRGEETPARQAGPALANLDPRRGCLAVNPPGELPQYFFADAERKALRDAVAEASSWTEPLPAEEQVTRTLARHQCLACHRRDELGGPRDDRREYFVIRGDAELGDEGRIPPHLDDVGTKLWQRTLEAVLLDEERVRPYMAARMPQYGKQHVAPLAALLTKVDHDPADDVEPEFTPEAVQIGRQLVGTEDGLGCINCHTLAGFDSLGVPAVDLATMTERIRPGWFHRLMADPMTVNMTTRMPKFWLEGKSPVDVLGGDPDAQIDAMWSYLSLGKSMPLPKGLVIPEAEYELEVIDEPIMIGVFMAGVSPRTLVVGFPESLHYAFDMQSSRLAKAWRGRFFNAQGTWHARAGALEAPPSEDRIDLPLGAPFAELRNEEQPWPDEPADVLGYRVLGRRYDDERRPAFRYRYQGATIEEKPYPKLERRGSWLVRSFELSADREPSGLYFRAATGQKLRSVAPGAWLVDDTILVQVPVAADGSGGGVWRANGDGQEDLVVPIQWTKAEGGGVVATFEVEMTW
ncbi:MAG: PA14 domain-containing protein [Planctomycetota bacterium]